MRQRHVETSKKPVEVLDLFAEAVYDLLTSTTALSVFELMNRDNCCMAQNQFLNENQRVPFHD